MAHPNEDLLRGGYEAFGRGDIDAVAGLMADDIVWHVAGRSQLAGHYTGKDAVRGWLMKNLELSGGTLRVEPHDILADDDHGVALLRITAEREGRSLDDRTVQVFHLEGQKLAEAWLHPGDLHATDEFWR